MRVGTICFATERGLGYLAKSFYDNGVVTDAILMAHRIPNHPEWYPDATMLRSSRNITDDPAFRKLVDDVDVMLFFETPFDWEVIPYCRQRGVKTALMLMYECTPERISREHTPDKYLCPSLLDLEYFPSGTFIPVPVDVPWQQRTTATNFVHNAGYIGLKGRHGTLELLKAMRYVESNITLTVRSQTKELQGVLLEAISEHPELKDDNRLKVEIQHLPYDHLYTGQDVFIDPEKFNGLSLPLQEARASGMLVMASDRFPLNTWLPKEALIRVSDYYPLRVASQFMKFQAARINPRDIAARIDEWSAIDITGYSLCGKEWAKTMSWDVLKPQYMNALSTW